MPTAPGVVSTVRNKSSSLSTIFTVSRDSFSLARMALIPPGPAANSARHHKIAAIGNPLGNRSNFIGLSRFAQVSRQYVQSRRLLASIPFEACVQPYASPQRSRAANPLLILPHHLPYRSVSASSWSALGSGTRTYPEFNSGQE